MLFTSYRQGRAAALKQKQEAAEAAQPPPLEEEPRSQVLSVEPITLEVGMGLIPLVNGPKGDLTNRVKKLRRQIARNLGLWVPKVRFVDNMQLQDREYAIKLSGAVVGRGEIHPDRLLVVGIGDERIEGLAAKDPVFGVDSIWITADEKRRVEARGYSVIEPSSVVITHLDEIMKANAEQLLRRDDVHDLVELVREVAPKLIEGLLPNQIGYGELSSVLKLLLAERVSIRDLRTILETIAVYVDRTKDPTELTELVRTALRRQICSEAAGPDGAVHAVMLEPSAEHEMRSCLSPSGELLMPVRTMQALATSLGEILETQGLGQPPPCLVVAGDLRRGLATSLPDGLRSMIKVLKGDEVASAELRLVGTVSL
jgi:flagellar biosynthesis protein FlhA